MNKLIEKVELSFPANNDINIFMNDSCKSKNNIINESDITPEYVNNFMDNLTLGETDKIFNFFIKTNIINNRFLKHKTLIESLIYANKNNLKLLIKNIYLLGNNIDFINEHKLLANKVKKICYPIIFSNNFSQYADPRKNVVVNDFQKKLILSCKIILSPIIFAFGTFGGLISGGVITTYIMFKSDC